MAKQKISSPSGAENDFWSTPGPSLRFPSLSMKGKDELLMDEMMGDVSMSSSIESPLAPSTRTLGRSSMRPTLREKPLNVPNEHEPPEESQWEEGPAIVTAEQEQEAMEETTASRDEAEDDDDDDEEEEGEGEKTVVLLKPPVQPPSPRPTTPQRDSPVNKSGLLTPPHSEMTPSSQSAKKSRVRISTEMERIVVRFYLSCDNCCGLISVFRRRYGQLLEKFSCPATHSTQAVGAPINLHGRKRHCT